MLCSCAAIDSERNAVGAYEMSSGRNRITLRVCGDHTFAEEITIPGKSTYRHKGRWEWRHGYVDFDELWVPKEFTPQSMIDADAGTAPGTSAYHRAGLRREMRQSSSGTVGLWQKAIAND